jgi:pyruvate dehydrogenase E2 component (dihydrolipoamide acetyltransferase)
VPSEVKLPRLGQGMESGTIVKWLKAEGEAVEKGELLYELDTEKVTQEVEAEASGVLLKIEVPEGEVAVGTTIAYIGEAGEQVADAKPPEPAEPAAEKPGQAEPEPAEPPTEGVAAKEPTATERELPPVAAVAAPPERQDGERVKASPLARRLAREQGIDLAALSGTGPDGRIVAEDVERATTAAAPAEAAPAEAAPAAEPEQPPKPEPAVKPEPALAAPIPADVERVPLTSIRRTIARRLTEAWTVPVYQLVLSADMDTVNQLVARRRELDPDERVTVTDVLVKVCAAALMRHRAVNVQFTEEELLVFPYANIGIAVATDRGLVVPVVHGAEHLSLAEVAAARADIVARAREGRLRQEDLDGGTFTISNLGMFGLDQFTAVLNPPQAAILAVGASQERPVVWEGQIVPRPTMTMTLTCDHRAVDGAPAAEFLETVKAMLEDLSLAL